jgi:hypothetical protein
MASLLTRAFRCLLLFFICVLASTESYADGSPPSAPRLDLRLLLAQAPAVSPPRRATSCPLAPSRVLRATPECGSNEKGEPRLGLFQCGLKLDAQRGTCEEDCRFVVCRAAEPASVRPRG